MSQEDYSAISRALTELGIAIVLGAPEVWTYEQRKIYEKATAALINYREDNGKS